MKKLCEKLRDDLEAILQEWRALAEAAKPGSWDRLGGDAQMDHMPGVVLGIVEASLCEPHDLKSHRENVLAAVHHGEVRRGQGFTAEDLFDEFDLLRKAIWRRLREIEPDAERSTLGIMRIDLAMTLATHASMRGYHREEIERIADWNAHLEELAASSPFLNELR